MECQTALNYRKPLSLPVQFGCSIRNAGENEAREKEKEEEREREEGDGKEKVKVGQWWPTEASRTLPSFESEERELKKGGEEE